MNLKVFAALALTMLSVAACGIPPLYTTRVVAVAPARVYPPVVVYTPPPPDYVYTTPPVVLGIAPAGAVGWYEDPNYGPVWVGWRDRSYVYLGGPRIQGVLIGRPAYTRSIYHVRVVRR